MEIVIKGRNSEISERFKGRVTEKLQRIEKYAQRARIARVDVVVSHEKNPRQHDNAARIEMTIRSRGPVIRAEATSTDQHTALDLVIDKLEARMRRASDRSRVHRGQRAPASLGKVAAALPDELINGIDQDEGPEVQNIAGIEVQGDSPIVVREKTHVTQPMSLDQALYEMELVGHDFFLFLEKDSMRPSVVYRRKAFDYGVIHLDVSEGV